METLTYGIDNGGIDTLDADAVIARIKASGTGTLFPPPSREAIDVYIAHVEATEPLSDEESAASYEAWIELQEEMRARDRADDIAEGRS